MFILKTSLSLLLFFVFIIYFTIRKVNPLCEKIIYTRKKVGGRPTSPAESRTSLSGLYTFTPSGHEIRHKRLTRFCASQSSFTYHALRVHHISGGPPYQVGPYAGPGRGAFLRAEGFPKRRCQFESVAAERRI